MTYVDYGGQFGRSRVNKIECFRSLNFRISNFYIFICAVPLCTWAVCCPERFATLNILRARLLFTFLVHLSLNVHADDYARRASQCVVIARGCCRIESDFVIIIIGPFRLLDRRDCSSVYQLRCWRFLVGAVADTLNWINIGRSTGSYTICVSYFLLNSRSINALILLI